MRMKKRNALLTLTLGLALSPVLGYGEQKNVTVAPEQWLLEKIRVGEASNRDDLVRQSLYRLESIAPDNPDVIAARIRLSLREGNRTLAQEQLAKLKAIAPTSEAYSQAQFSLKLTDPEVQQQLQQARLLATAGQLEQARIAYESLFDGVLPKGDLSLEYLKLLSRLPDQKKSADSQLQVQLKQNPDDVNMQLLKAQKSFEQGQNEQGFKWLEKAATKPSGITPAAEMWMAQIQQQPVNAKSVAALQHYLTVFVEGTPVINGRQELSRQQALLTNPAYLARLNGLAKIENGESSSAIAPLKQALKAEPDDAELVGALGLAYSRSGDRQQAIGLFQRAQRLDPNSGKWRSLIQTNRYWLLIEQGDRALKTNELAQAEKYYLQAKSLDSRDPWALIGLGDVALAKQQEATAEQQYLRALAIESDNSSAQRGLVNIYQNQSPQKALDYLNGLPIAQREKLKDKQEGIQRDLLTAKAEGFAQQGQFQQAADIYQQVLNLSPDDVWVTYRYAQALRQSGKLTEADTAFLQLVKQRPTDPQQVYAYSLYLSGSDRADAALKHLNSLPDAQWDDNMREMSQRLVLDKTLSEIDQLIAQGKKNQARESLQRADIKVDSLNPNQQRNVAMAWLNVGETARANSLLQRLKTQAYNQPAGQDKALIFRDAARLERLEGRPLAAEEDYKQAMVASNITDRIPQDNDSYTRLTRNVLPNNTDDEWLQRSIRSDAHDLYRQQDVNFTLDNDYWQSSGTSGQSDLAANTTMMQVDMPWYQGRAFLRSDIVYMDAGTFENQQGNYSQTFGTCAEQVCSSDLNQTATGVSFGVGWENERWKGDFGSTPFGFPVVDWVGGLSYNNDWRDIGWTTTVSRRPIARSLLSFAGARDPGTGTTWGGVRATGVSLGLSYDQGGANGLWGDISAHQITGKNVADNTRQSLMAGYYYKIINENNRQVTVGLNNMMWSYQKDLSGYTLGQGGYYSPQQYISFSVPVDYRQRTENWSWQLGGSVSWSRSSNQNQNRYPLQNLVPDELVDKRVIENGSGSTGFGYTAQAMIERRLSSHWTIGTSIDIQQARDYAPNHFLVYVRYSLAGWQGDLDLPPRPLIPYADFK